MALEPVQRDAQGGMRGRIAGRDHGGLVEGFRCLARPVLAHQGAPHDKLQCIRTRMERYCLGQHIYGALMAADFPQRARKADGRLQLAWILAELGGPEIRARQRIGAFDLGDFLGRGRGQLFLIVRVCRRLRIQLSGVAARTGRAGRSKGDAKKGNRIKRRSFE